MARAILGRFVAVFSSLGTSTVLVLLLALLTWLGTLEQAHSGLYEVQRKYFESFVLLHDLGPISIPLPGATLVLVLLFVNLLVGGLVRLRRGASTYGVFTAHVGIALLLVAAFVKQRFCEDGHVTLREGESADHFESWFRYELAVLESLDGTHVREHLVPQECLETARAGPVHVRIPGLAFTLEIDRVLTNCRPERVELTTAAADPDSTPIVDGVRLTRRPNEKAAEANIAGASVIVVDAANHVRRPTLCWGAETRPFTFLAQGRAFGLSLRKERHPLPFALRLERFTKEDHPRSDMPKSFASDVRVVAGTSERDVRISMNEPLRDGGLVLYQASFGPANARPGDRLFSTFAVVRNPADSWPLVACLVIALGLVGHFTRKLVRFVRLEARLS